MAQKTVKVVLGTAVADSSDLTIAYPAGTNQAFFTSGNASATGVVVVNGNDTYTEADATIDITYDSGYIDVTNDSGVTWPAGAEVIIGLGYLVPDNVTVVQQAAQTDLGGSLTGTNDGSLSNVSTLTDSPATADALRDDLHTNWKPVIDGNFKEIQAAMNALLAKLRAAGVLDT